MAVVQDYMHGECHIIVYDDFIDNTLVKDTVIANIQYHVYKDQLQKKNGVKGRER